MTTTPSTAVVVYDPELLDAEHGPGVGRARPPLRPFPSSRRTQDQPQHRGHRHRPRTRRVRVGRNDRVAPCHTVRLVPGVSWPRARTPPCAGAPPPQNRPPFKLCPTLWALLVQGTFLRIAELRNQPAYISLAVSPPASPRRMVEPSPDPHQPSRGPRRSSRHPGVNVVRPRFAAGAPR